MKKLIAEYKISEYEIGQLEGEFADKSHYDYVIDYDCKVFTKTDKPVLFFIKNFSFKLSLLFLSKLPISYFIKEFLKMMS